MTTSPGDRPDAPDDDTLRAHLDALRRDEPRFNVTDQVRTRLEASPRPAHRFGGLRRAIAVAALVLLLASLGTAVVAPDAIRAAGAWFRSLVVREGPQPGQPGGQRIVIVTPSAGGGPFRTVALADAQRAVAFPVQLPQRVPAGYRVASVQLFQPDPAMPPQQVLVTYTSGNAPPFEITYSAPGARPQVGGAPGAIRPLTVGGYPAVYIDDALSGTRRPNGSPVATGRLVVERPDVVLLLGGDRDAGLDATALAALAQSIP